MHTGPPRVKLSAGSPRIVSPVAEGITAVVVLVDARATDKVTLAQLTDYIAMVSLAQLDLTADLGEHQQHPEIICGPAARCAATRTHGLGLRLPPWRCTVRVISRCISDATFAHAWCVSLRPLTISAAESPA